MTAYHQQIKSTLEQIDKVSEEPSVHDESSYSVQLSSESTAGDDSEILDDHSNLILLDDHRSEHRGARKFSSVPSISPSIAELSIAISAPARELRSLANSLDADDSAWHRKCASAPIYRLLDAFTDYIARIEDIAQDIENESVMEALDRLEIGLADATSALQLFENGATAAVRRLAKNKICRSGSLISVQARTLDMYPKNIPRR